MTFGTLFYVRMNDFLNPDANLKLRHVFKEKNEFENFVSFDVL